MMIRTGLYQLSIRSAEYTPKLASIVVRPAAVAISGKGGHWFSTNTTRQDDELIQKDYSESFDESDALEKGKGKFKTSIEKIPKRLARYNGPIFRPPGGFDEFFSPFFSRDPFAPFFAHNDLMPVLRNFPRDPHKIILRTSPGYEIKESEGSYEVAIDVPEGVGASDMKVEVDDDMIHLSGERKVKEKGMLSETRFNKRFTIGTNVDTDNITANFKDGVLVLKAPKLEVTAPHKKTITITEDPHVVTQEELIQKNYSDTIPETKQYDPLTSIDDDEKVGKYATMNTPEDEAKQYDPLTSIDDDEKDIVYAATKTTEDESKQYDPLTSIDDDEKVGKYATMNTPEDEAKQYDPLTSIDDDEKDGMKI
jgi:HSP20 family protein